MCVCERKAGGGAVWRMHVRTRRSGRAEQHRGDWGREWELQTDRDREEERAETSSTSVSVGCLLSTAAGLLLTASGSCRSVAAHTNLCSAGSGCSGATHGGRFDIPRSGLDFKPTIPSQIWHILS